MNLRLTFGSLASAAVSAALVVSAPVPAAAQDSADLASAVTALRAISTMRADFVQADARGQQVRGVLTLKRPGRIRFQYEKGVPMLVVSDGSALTFVDYEVRQVQRWPIKSSPLGALLDPSRDVGKFGRVMPTGSDRIVSIEVRDKARPEYGVITLVFTRKGDAPGGSNCRAGPRSTRRSGGPSSPCRISNMGCRLQTTPSASTIRAGPFVDDSQRSVVDRAQTATNGDNSLTIVHGRASRNGLERLSTARFETGFPPVA